ncbi:MAG TPA: ATP-dependent DNA helicase [Epsilonproteobacteria bacterium]|nr:ATP-dependent DNA helicase [Campylobacterota bacterium]
MTLQELIHQGESKTLELKETLPKNDSIAKTVVAFSNTSGGKLIIGINDKREPVGIDDQEIFELQDRIASIISDSCHPNILPEIYTLNTHGKILLVIEVSRGNLLPYYLKQHGKDGGVYVRLGATNRQASSEMIQELERQRVHQSFDEQIAWDRSLESLDLTPLQKAFDKIGKTLDHAKLLSLKLIKQEQDKAYPTHGLLILLGLYEHVEIKCARFKGTTMAVFLDKKEYRGDLFSQLEQTELFIKNHLHLKAEILGLQRTETYEIPIPAIREALVNAIVHRDYSNFGRDIKVGIYDDILNIVSPGGLPNGVTIDEVLSGRSEIRNKVVARVFKELGYIEQWGSGLSRMNELCREANIQEPKTKESGDFFDIEFVRPIVTEKVSDTDDYGRLVSDTAIKPSDNRRIPSDCSEQEKAVIEYLFKNQTIKSKQVEKLLGIKESRTRELLHTMTEKGYIVKLGSARSTHYKLSKVAGDE